MNVDLVQLFKTIIKASVWCFLATVVIFKLRTYFIKSTQIVFFFSHSLFCNKSLHCYNFFLLSVFNP